MTPISLALKILLALLPAIAAAYGTYEFMSGKIEVLTLGKQAAEQAVKDDEQIIKDLKAQTATNGRITNDYETKLSQLRSNFASKPTGMRNAASNQVPTNLSDGAGGSHATGSDPVLVEQCSETTLMLSAIQAWAKAQGLAQE
jgi:hypothetical protein